VMSETLYNHKFKMGESFPHWHGGCALFSTSKYVLNSCKGFLCLIIEWWILRIKIHASHHIIILKYNNMVKYVYWSCKISKFLSLNFVHCLRFFLINEWSLVSFGCNSSKTWNH
jgi:hypothetical protein